MNATEVLAAIAAIYEESGTDERKIELIRAALSQLTQDTRVSQSETTRAVRAWARQIPTATSAIGKGAREGILLLADAVDELAAKMKLVEEGAEDYAAVFARRVNTASRIEIVSAPGDMCGNTKKLPDGSRCPGCRACS